MFGQLGAGKTVLAKGIALGLGIAQDKIVSPTFVLVRQQIGKYKFPFYHFDFYRLNNPADILALGYEEYFYAEGVTVIEWPERLSYLLPKDFLKIELSLKSDSQRLIKCIAFGKRYKELLNQMSRRFTAV